MGARGPAHSSHQVPYEMQWRGRSVGRGRSDGAGASGASGGGDPTAPGRAERQAGAIRRHRGERDGCGTRRRRTFVVAVIISCVDLRLRALIMISTMPTIMTELVKRGPS
eukprot:1181863-Prorocentrum_minimum.AAC.1